MNEPITPTLEAELYFKQMEEDQKPAEAAYASILAAIDRALSKQDYSVLLSLIPYIENGEGLLAFNYIGKTHRFLRILHIIELELKYKKPLFSEGCRTAEELINKYMLIMFCLRRLLFQMSEESVNEAIYYLRQHPISHLAAYSMMQDELLVPDSTLYENVAVIYSETAWSIEDTQEFFSLIGTN